MKILAVIALFLSVGVANSATLKLYQQHKHIYYMGQRGCDNVMVYQCYFLVFDNRRLAAKVYKDDPTQTIIQLLEYRGSNDIVELDPDLLLSI